MDWRTRRQLMMLAVFLLVLLAMGFGTYYLFFYEPGTCFDAKKNQGEEEVDCGGPCAPCAFKHQKPVQVFFARFLQSRPTNYDIIAQIQNPNDHLAANPLLYRMRLFDDKGAEVGRRENQTYIYPNDKIYVVESNFVTERTVVEARLEIIDDETKWEYTNEIRPDLTLGNKKYEVIRQDSVEVGRVTADLTNRSDYTYQEVNVRVALLDPDGNIMAAGATVVDKMKSGESRSMQFVWPAKPAGTVARIEMEARANGLNRLNLLP